ncbi:MAG: hypothetical protein H0U74_02295 [Bradymonadaceae bacterium]|nr:hypothetical protein [Lujinxingiaceae bacterium]
MNEMGCGKYHTVGLFLSFLMAVSGCTQGGVSNAQDGSLLGGATVKFYAWPPVESTRINWVWPASFRLDDADYATTTAALSWDGANYGFGAEGSCVNGVSEVLPTHRWYRVRVDRPGFLPGIFYRYHGGYEDQCRYFQCESGQFANGSCNTQHFALWPENSVHPRLPDLIVDDRDLNERYWQCARMPGSAPDLVGIRAAVGTANVGTGGLHLEGIDFDPATPEDARIIQRIDWSDGRLDERELTSAAFEFHLTHDHIHFRDWVRMELISTRSECDDRGQRPAGCAQGSGGKISFCIMDLALFDAEIRDIYDGQRRYPDPPACDSLQQGLTQGWKDVYSARLAGQSIVVGTAAELPGLEQRYWLEVEVDPNERIIESDRSNNFSRVGVDLPSDLTALCTSSPDRLDCSMPRSQYTSFEQRHQCPQYLEFLQAM